MKQKMSTKNLLLLLLLFYTPLAFAGNAALMLETFAKSFPALWRLTTASAYVIGFIFMIRAMQGFREFGERHQGGSHMTAKKPLLFFIVGTVLIFTPSVTTTLMMSTFGTASPLQLPTTGGVDLGKYWAVLAFVQLIGMIAFIRGWVLIAGSSQQGSHSPMGKAITHIVGGLMALNIGGLMDVINRSFGIGA
jgi:intracellular multiplication protein IcmC